MITDGNGYFCVMIHRNSNIRLLSLLVALSFFFSAAFADALSDFTSSPAINAPKAAVYIADLRNGNELAAHNVDMPLIPASIMKSVTTATLLEKTGARYKYITPVYFTGSLHDGVIDGDIIVRASGDPTINSSHEPRTPDFVGEIVSALKSLHVREITGSVIVDQSKFPGPAVNPLWADGDLQYAYGTGTHGFNFEDNANRNKSVKDPSAVFKSRLNAALQKEGITLRGQQLSASGKRHLLGEHHSATIDEIMRSCMMRSDNQYAESMLRLVGDRLGNEASSSAGAKKMTQFWKDRHASMNGVQIIDGSGLSRSNRVTARFMADVLKRLAKNPYYASFFPLAGQEGTLRRFLQDTYLNGYVAMKTGSMKGIQCYAGYKLDENYAPTHIIVVIMNEMGNRENARKQVEKLLLANFPQR